MFSILLYQSYIEEDSVRWYRKSPTIYSSCWTSTCCTPYLRI